MRLICIATTATVLMSGAGQAHTINSDAEAASALLMLVAVSEHPETQGVARDGDLSRSPEQVRRARLTIMHRTPSPASFRIAVQKPPM